MAHVDLRRLVPGHARRARGLPAPREQGVALVTGASSGIGECFARALAERGHNLVLVARRVDRLDALASSLRKDGVRVDVVGCDLRDPESIEGLLARLAEKRLEVQLLVNNAGFGVWGPFAQEDLARQLDQIKVHAEAVVALTHPILRGMLERQQGAIIHVASSAAFQPIPYQAVYAASKAFLLSLSEALDAEVRGSGVSVVAVNPGPVATEFEAVSGLPPEREPAPMVSAQRVVEEAIRAVERGRRSTVPGWRMRALMWGAKPVPAGLKLAHLERAYRPDLGRTGVRDGGALRTSWRA